MKSHLTYLIVLVLSCFSINSVFAIDVVKLGTGRSSKDMRSIFKAEIITKALQLTENEYGAYRIDIDNSISSNDKAIRELKTGKKINAYIALTNKNWEKNTIAIKIPVRRGILNYRLLLVRKSQLDRFKSIQNINDLKKLKVGLLNDWATTDVLLKNDFKVSQSTTTNELFSFLSLNQIDYIPRGVNEIYEELSQRSYIDDLVIEPTLALYVPAVTYIFVSPTQPRLATRLAKGLEKMVASSQLNSLFDKYYGEKLTSANLDSRRIIYLKNPELPSETPLNRKELWFEYDTFFN